MCFFNILKKNGNERKKNHILSLVCINGNTINIYVPSYCGIHRHVINKCFDENMRNLTIIIKLIANMWLTPDAFNMGERKKNKKVKKEVCERILHYQEE